MDKEKKHKNHKKKGKGEAMKLTKCQYRLLKRIDYSGEVGRHHQAVEVLKKKGLICEGCIMLITTKKGEAILKERGR